MKFKTKISPCAERQRKVKNMLSLRLWLCASLHGAVGTFRVKTPQQTKPPNPTLYLCPLEEREEKKIPKDQLQPIHTSPAAGCGKGNLHSRSRKGHSLKPPEKEAKLGQLTPSPAVPPLTRIASVWVVGYRHKRVMGD